MKVGSRAAMFTRNGFSKFVVISECGVSSGVDNHTCYKTEEGALFLMKAELGTGRHYNVGNKACWIIQAIARG